jgi:hypothetical protein
VALSFVALRQASRKCSRARMLAVSSARSSSPSTPSSVAFHVWLASGHDCSHVIDRMSQVANTACSMMRVDAQAYQATRSDRRP